MKKVSFLNILFSWIPLAVTVVLLTLFTYVAVQQDLRLSANNRPAQIVDDVAYAFSNGQGPSSLLGEQINLSHSPAPFIIIFDKNQKVVASSALLDGKSTTLPKGVLDNVSKKGESRLTWQPREGIREAVVIKKTNNGFVAAGQSLKETEKNISALGRLSFFALILILGSSLFVFFLSEIMRPKFIHSK